MFLPPLLQDLFPPTPLTQNCSGQQVLSWMPCFWRRLGLWRQC